MNSAVKTRLFLFYKKGFSILPMISIDTALIKRDKTLIKILITFESVQNQQQQNAKGFKIMTIEKIMKMYQPKSTKIQSIIFLIPFWILLKCTFLPFFASLSGYS